MPTLNLTAYNESIKKGDIASSIKNLKTQYELADYSLSLIAGEIDPTIDWLIAETEFLENKDFLISLATKIKCSDIQNISQKVDFLNTVLLKEKTQTDFSLTDCLTQSIWEDCQIYL